MAMYVWLILGLSVPILLVDGWFYLKMKKREFKSWFRIASLLPGILFILSFFYIRFGLRYTNNPYLVSKISWLFVALVIIYVPKILYILFYYINALFNLIFKTHTRGFRYVGFVLNIGFVALILYSVAVTRDDIYLKEQVVEVRNLPKNFDGYRIALFADMHLGNWDRKYSIMKPIISMINRSHPNIIVFAGDLINNYEQETHGWESYFRQLKSKNGTFAILGNHDYGDYSHWHSEKEKRTNLQLTERNIRNLGFQLLLNGHTDLIQGKDTITLVGVENFGSGHFRNYCNLNKALEGIKPNRMKILLSHNPNEWTAEVVGKHPDIFLTLSGHTHAGQLGLVEGKIRFSIASANYPQWDGLYSKGNQYLYVNRGIGYVGMPIRVGVPPEVTLIILKRAK